MPSRYYQRTYSQGGFYHLYNRGSNKQKVFLDSQDYQTFLDILAYYLRFPHGKAYSHINLKDNPKQVPNLQPPYILLCYCLMPNHFHFLLKQILYPTVIDTPTNLMRRLSITYSMYFNAKYTHSGNLFQGKFKNVTINTESQLLHLTKYIHRNPHEIAPLNDYPFSSYPNYLNKQACDWLYPQEILSYFSSTNPHRSYRVFVEDEDKENTLSIDHLLLEDPGSEPGYSQI